MRSNNFFDQFNDEIGDAVNIIKISLISGGIVIVLIIGAACFRLLR
jgi:hypothetical protein